MQLIGSDQFTIIIGLGKTGISCARFLAARKIPFAVADTRKAPANLASFQQQFPGIEVCCGDLEPDWLKRANRLLVSPGVSRKEPAIVTAETAGVEVLGDIDLFCQSVSAPIIAITGSNAKSTVTTWVGEMALDAGVDVGVGGNLGTPVLDLLEAGEKALYVLELSSFQLETTDQLRAEVATILNVSPDHMDRYDDLAGYHRAKTRIYRGCKRVVFNHDDHLTQPLLPDNLPQISFRLGRPDLNQFGVVSHQGELHLAKGLQPLLPVNALKLRGSHNQANALASLALGDAVGLPMPSMLQTLQRFGGLRHRCQWLRQLDGVDYYNDSKGTNVGATLAAIEGLGADRLAQTPPGKVVLIAGGEGKGAEFTDLAEPMRRYGRHAVLIGTDRELLASALEEAVPCQQQDTLDAAVTVAQQLAEPGDVVMLSPACASFDMFSGFEHRGECFETQVQALKPSLQSATTAGRGGQS
ncbi:MAG: UDP-N-acetylmuramoyl-L-alanine--D-glutamate ligase [Motiliproteus sp.]